MKIRSVLMLMGAMLAVSSVALAQSGAPQHRGDKAAAEGGTRSEAEKRAARRAANEARVKQAAAQGQGSAAREEDEEEEESKRKP